MCDKISVVVVIVYALRKSFESRDKEYCLYNNLVAKSGIIYCQYRSYKCCQYQLRCNNNNNNNKNSDLQIKCGVAGCQTKKSFYVRLAR